MEEPIQPYSDSLHSYTWKEDDDTIHLRRKKEKRARYTSHEEFLNKCIATNLIPAGFKIHLDKQRGDGTGNYRQICKD